MQLAALVVDGALRQKEGRKEGQKTRRPHISYGITGNEADEGSAEIKETRGGISCSSHNRGFKDFLGLLLCREVRSVSGNNTSGEQGL